MDSAEKPEDIDRVRAKEAKIRAEERLRQKESLKEYKQSEASLARALTRLKVNRKDIKTQRRNPKRLLAGNFGGFERILTRSRSA